MKLTFYYINVKSSHTSYITFPYTIEVTNPLGRLLNENSLDYLREWSTRSYKVVNPDYLYTDTWFKESIDSYYQNIVATPLATHNLVSSYSLEYAIHYYYNVADYRKTNPEVYI